MASVSMAARESFFVTTISRVNNQARSPAVRSDHLPPTRTRFTPRGAYSFCSCKSSARTSTPAGSRVAKTVSSSGSSAANSKASRIRSSSARASLALLPTITRISATFPIIPASPSSIPIPRFHSYAFDLFLPLANIKRSKSSLLMHFKTAFAYQLKRGGKTRRPHRRRMRRLDHIRDEILVEHMPIRRVTDQPFDGFARLAKRPHRALRQAHISPRLFLPLSRVSRKQIVERRRPFRLPDLGDRLRKAAGKNLAAELRPVEQLLGHLTDRFEPPQPLRQRGRHVLGAQAVGLMLFGQQQARFQIGEPRRHHQIIGGEFEPQFARLFDEGQILIGQREYRYLGKIDLLLAGKRQQEIERTFKALDVDHKRRLIRRTLRELGFELHIFGDHAYPCAGCQIPAISLWNSTRPAARSNGVGFFRAANAAADRCAASPASNGVSAATASISGISPLQWSTRSHPAAMAARVRSPSDPDNAPMEMSSLISRPLKPIESRITSRTIVAETVAGATGSTAVNTTCAVIAIGSAASGRNAAKSVASRTARSALTTGSAAWLSAVARPWPGMCLSTGRMPPAANPWAIAPAIAATLPGSVP